MDRRTSRLLFLFFLSFKVTTFWLSSHFKFIVFMTPSCSFIFFFINLIQLILNKMSVLMQVYFKATDPFNERWQSAWIITAFWDVLAFGLLCVICYLWAPSQSSQRCANNFTFLTSQANVHLNLWNSPRQQHFWLLFCAFVYYVSFWFKLLISKSKNRLSKAQNLQLFHMLYDNMCMTNRKMLDCFLGLCCDMYLTMEPTSKAKRKIIFAMCATFNYFCMCTVRLDC